MSNINIFSKQKSKAQKENMIIVQYKWQATDT